MKQTFNTRDRMKFFGIKPSKSLGQNFLNDIGVVQEICLLRRSDKRRSRD